jgi:hypothetical protein
VLQTKLEKWVPARPSSLRRIRVNICRNGRAMGLVNLSRDEEVREVRWAMVRDDEARDAAFEVILDTKAGQRDFTARLAQ